jgi:hypothetical protein
MGGWQMTMTCPNCGGELKLQANGRPSEGGQRLVNVLRCQKNGCSRQWVHTQTLRSMTGAELDGAA